MTDCLISKVPLKNYLCRKPPIKLDDNEKMNILILGSGGRESAFAWKISQSKRVNKLFVAPGNAGTSAYSHTVLLDPLNFEGIGEFCVKESIKMVIVGPEEPLVKGIHDYFKSHESLKDILVIGPESKGAQLEGSKHFSKQFMQRYNIPTAPSRSFREHDLTEAFEYIEKQPLPIVLKADGLAAGKGVLICADREEAKTEIRAMLSEGKFGEAGRMVVVESFLSGIELSVFVLTDGNSYKILPAAKDYKRIGVGDSGLNTGGMGSVSPVPFADDDFLKKVEDRIVLPTLNGLKSDEIPYVGFIFIGLMNVNGDPFVIEYNVRMGDPETQSVLPRIQNDFVELLSATGNGTLDEIELQIDSKTAASVVLVSGGYPGNYTKGEAISGLENVKESIVFHAGTKANGAEIETNGGRVLAVTALEDTMFNALQQATADSGRIFYKGRYFRTDIGYDLINYVENDQI